MVIQAEFPFLIGKVLTNVKAVSNKKNDFACFHSL